MAVERAAVIRALPARYELLPPAPAERSEPRRARDRFAGRDVLVHAFVLPDQDARQAAAATARELARVEHPHLARCVDVIDADPVLLVLEAVPAGRPLREQPRPVSVETACALGLAVAGALEAAHRHGITHRALSPDTVYLTDAASVVLAGTGLADLAAREPGTGEAVAVPTRGGDLYSLALVLHWLLGGAAPPDRSALFPGTPGPIAAVGRRALELDLARRYPSAREFALDLAAAAAGCLGPGWLARASLAVRVDDDVLAAASAAPGDSEPGATAGLATAPALAEAAPARAAPVTGAPMPGRGTGPEEPADAEGTAGGPGPAPPRRRGRRLPPLPPIGRTGRAVAAGCLVAVTAAVAALAVVVSSNDAPALPTASATPLSAPVSVSATAVAAVPRVDELHGGHGQVNAVAFSPDGRTLAAVTRGGALELWDVQVPGQTTLRSTIRLPGTTEQVLSVAFAPKGRALVAVGAFDGRLWLWDVTNPAKPAQAGNVDTAAVPASAGTAVRPDGVYSVAFSPDGHLVATGNDDNAVRLWDVTDPARPAAVGAPMLIRAVLPGEAIAVSVDSVAFSPDGHTLLGVDSTGPARLWDVTDPARPRSRTVLDDATVQVAAFSPDGSVLATAAGGQGVRLWDLQDPSAPAPFGRTITTNGDMPAIDVAVTFAPNAHTLAYGAPTGTVLQWDVRDPTRPSALSPAVTDEPGPVRSLAYTPGGRLLAGVGVDGVIRLWQTGTTAAPRGHA